MYLKFFNNYVNEDHITRITIQRYEGSKKRLKYYLREDASKFKTLKLYHLSQLPTRFFGLFIIQQKSYFYLRNKLHRKVIHPATKDYMVAEIYTNENYPFECQITEEQLKMLLEKLPEIVEIC